MGRFSLAGKKGFQKYNGNDGFRPSRSLSVDRRLTFGDKWLCSDIEHTTIALFALKRSNLASNTAYFPHDKPLVGLVTTNYSTTGSQTPNLVTIYFLLKKQPALVIQWDNGASRSLKIYACENFMLHSRMEEEGDTVPLIPFIPFRFYSSTKYQIFNLAIWCKVIQASENKSEVEVVARAGYLF